MTGISPQELRERVIRPTLAFLSLGGDAAEELLLGTAMQESRCGAHIVQIGGPALGIWQMEPSTHDDIWTNFLDFRQPLRAKVLNLLMPTFSRTEQLVGNLSYACAMARVQYFRSPRPLPAAGDLAEQASLYKVVYNGPGKATTDQYIANARGLFA